MAEMSAAAAVDPHAPPPLSPLAAVSGLWRHRRLIVRMTRREVAGRYRGSVFGLAWSFFNPLLMLAVYTFVFSVVFKARWGAPEEGGKVGFALILFVGMIVHGIFAEVVNRAPGLLPGNANYVRKVVFPLEILPAVSLGAALFHALVSVGVLLLAFILANGPPPWTAVCLPLVFLPLLLLSLGAGWFFAALGVFVRDIGQGIGIATTVLLFVSPVFYPASALPAEFRPWMAANPLSFIIEQARGVLFWGQLPDWPRLALHCLGAAAVAQLGFVWFQKTRKGFSDVL